MLTLFLAALGATGITAIDAERAFARDAQKKGQWTASRAYADPDAVMFTPQAIWARDFLKGRRNPQAALNWSPSASYVSCDGRMAVNTGPCKIPMADKAAFLPPCGSRKRASGTGSPMADTRLRGRLPRARRRSCARVHVEAAHPVRRSWPHPQQRRGPAAWHRMILAGDIRQIGRLDGSGGSHRTASGTSAPTYGRAEAIRLRLIKRSAASEQRLIDLLCRAYGPPDHHRSAALIRQA